MKSEILLLVVGILLLVPASSAMAEAVFSVSDMKVEPAETTVGQTVTITVAISNLSYEDGTYTANLKINDEIVDSQDVTLKGTIACADPLRDVKYVEFTFIPLEENTYKIAIGDRETTLVVTLDGIPPPVMEPEPVVLPEPPLGSAPELVVNPDEETPLILPTPAHRTWAISWVNLSPHMWLIIGPVFGILVVGGVVYYLVLNHRGN